MTEKEEKAIERLKYINRHYYCNNNYYFKYDLDCIETVIQALEQKDKEIQELKEKWNKDTHTLQNQLDAANADRVEKDKIIDLMARFIDTELSSEHLSKVLKIEVKPLETYREDIKQ